MLPEERALAMFQSLHKITLETNEDGVQWQRHNIKNEDLNAASTVAGKLGRGDSLKIDREALQGQG